MHEYKPPGVLDVLRSEAPAATADHNIDEKKVRNTLSRLARESEKCRLAKAQDKYRLEKVQEGTPGPHGRKPIFRNLPETPAQEERPRRRKASSDQLLSMNAFFGDDQDEAPGGGEKPEPVKLGAGIVNLEELDDEEDEP